jgi:hypothetical protein
MSGGSLRRVGVPAAAVADWWVSMPSMSGGSLRHGGGLLGVSRKSRRFYALDVGRVFATVRVDTRVYVVPLFLCPRCRAGLCDGCLLNPAMTWAFSVRCAILAGTAALGKRFEVFSRNRPLTRTFPAPTDAQTALSLHLCTGSRHDPEVLTFLDHPGAQHHHAARSSSG